MLTRLLVASALLLAAPATAGTVFFRLGADPGTEPGVYYEWELEHGGVLEQLTSQGLVLEHTLEVASDTLVARYRRCDAAGCGLWSADATWVLRAPADLDHDGVVQLTDWGLFQERFGLPATDHLLCQDQN